MKRFIKVVDGLYRGGAPTVGEIKSLYDKFDVRKIVSLDAAAGHRINRICKLLGINHIIIPIDMIHIEPIAKLLSYNLHDLLINNGPTFIHCLEGKDRTGMVIAMFKCKYLDWDCHKAIDEAKNIGFGIGLNPKVTKLYEKLICLSCSKNHDHANLKHIDNNSADIVSQERDNKEYILDNVDLKSFSPYLDVKRYYPYNYSYDQYPTRDNVELKQKIDKEISKGDNTPLVGLYDNNSGIKGVGPVENGGGFVNT